MFNELCFIAQIIMITASTIVLGTMGKEALIAYVGLLFVMANIFVIKQINLFGWTVTSSDAFIIGVGLSINILQEFWGKDSARKAIIISFALSLIYLMIGACINAYIPALQDEAHAHLSFIMAHTTRIIIASFISYLITQAIDIQVYGYLKKQADGKYFVIRNYFALCLSQLIDTILFSFLGLWGIVANIGDIILVSYSVKLFAIFCMSPFLMLAKKIIGSKVNPKQGA